MTRRGRINITEERKKYIEKHWGPIETLGDDDAQEIAQKYIADEITYAKFEDEETIYYEYDMWDESPESFEPYPSWSEEYLNTLGMSMRDFF